MTISVLMITGSYPPDVCGVGDYTYCLMNSAVALKQGWKIYHSANWSLGSFFQKLKEIRKIRAEVVIMQVPTIGYGWSLLPHILTFWFSCFTSVKYVVMLHEYSQLSKKARFAAGIILWSANYVIFSNQFDRAKAMCNFRRLKQKSSVIKIFSNIKAVSEIKHTNLRKVDIVNFGHIRPGKGLEEFIQVVEKIRQNGNDLKAVIIGEVPQGYESYFDFIVKKASEQDISILLNKTNDEVANLLNDCKIAYLPFPDGVSERRGSFLAAVRNGVIVVSTSGKYSYQELADSIVITTKDKAYTDIIRVLSMSPEKQIQLQYKGINFLHRCMPSSWDDVAESYVRIIDQLTENR